MNSYKKPLSCITAALVAMTVQGVSAKGLEEIVVTAQKRSENQQDVPITISTATAERLANAGVTSTLDLAQITPGLSMPVNVGRVVPRLRGVGSSSNGPGLENSVAVYVDDVYIAASNASVFSLSNVERVEVLKGPQGTLFGRNATGGVVHVVTKDPEQELGGDISIGYGNYDTITTSGYVTNGITDTVAADLAFYYQNQGDGFGTNYFDGKDINETDLDLALKSKWLFDLSDSTTLRLSGDYNKLKTSTGFAFRLWPGTTTALGPFFVGGDEYDANSDVSPELENESWGVTARLDHDFGFASLASITAYRNSSYDRAFDLEGTPVQALVSAFYAESDQFSQEFQLASNSDGAFHWLAGLYFLDLEDELDTAHTDVRPPAGPPGGLSSITGNVLKAQSTAVFGELTFDITEKTSLILGSRYTMEDKDAENAYNLQVRPLGSSTGTYRYGPADFSTDFEKFTWRMALNHHFSDDVMGYASINTGFKSGGFNSANPTEEPFLPEELTAYEIGLKADLFDQRLRLNTSVFYYDYQDIQVTHRESGLATIFNGAESEIYGIDIDFEAIVTDNLTLTGGLELLDHEFTDFPSAAAREPVLCPVAPTVANGFISCPNGSGGYIGGMRDILPDGIDASGNGLTYTPDTTFNVTADYRIPMESGELHLSATYTYNDGYYFEVDNLRKQDNFDTVNASIMWTDSSEKYSVRLWGRNLTDETYVNNYAAQREGEQVFYAPPRTYGVTFKMDF